MSDQSPHASPVTAAQRIVSLDVLRAVALLGIFVINLPSFVFPPAVFFNPNYSGTFWGADRIVWIVSHMLFEQKMMAIFSMLFGAGVLLMTSRAQSKGDKPLRLHMRRMGWLFLIGMLHAYLIWEGDILVAYALCGALIFPLRKLSARTLAILGAITVAIAIPLGTSQGLWFASQRDNVTSIQLLQEAGETLAEGDKKTLMSWNNLMSDFQPDAEQLEKTTASFTGSYTDRFEARFMSVVFMQTYVFLTWTLWRAAGMMLIGMALYKWGFLTGALSVRRYATTALIGYAVGLPVIALGIARIQSSGYDFIDTFIVNGHFNYLGSVPVAIAHAAVVMLLLKSAVRTVLARVLAPYGRMALTNYLGQSVIAAALFYGYGFGLWGELDRVGLVGVMLAVWTAQIIFSHTWLGAFRFGPAEWVWRALSYWYTPPMRKG